MHSIHHNFSTSSSSSSSSLLGHNRLNSNRAQNVAIQGRNSGLVVKCVATPEKTSHKTEVSRNENLAKLQAGYLFPEGVIM